jgi:hypothetical protein
VSELVRRIVKHLMTGPGAIAPGQNLRALFLLFSAVFETAEKLLLLL